MLTLRPSTLTEAAHLIRALNAELSAIYPEEGATHFSLEAEQIAPGRGLFLIACIDDAPHHPIACGAIRLLDSTTAELKRMYVTPAHRKKGIAAKILLALEAEAQRLGVTTILLETGRRLPAAVNLYTHAGYQTIPNFGPYVNSPLSLCMSKTLSA